MNNRATKNAAEDEVDPPDDLDPGDDEDDDEDEDDDDEDDEDDEDEDEGEMTREKVAQGVAQAIRDAMETQVSAIAEKGRVLLDLDDDSRWILTIKERD